MKVPEILNPFTVSYTDREAEYPSLAAFIYAKALERCGKAEQLRTTPTSQLTQVYERLYNDCVNEELALMMKEGYAYATSLSNAPELHERLKNASEIRVSGAINGIDIRPIVERILGELQKNYSKAPEKEEIVKHTEIAIAMNYYTSAKEWFVKSGDVNGFRKAPDDLFNVKTHWNAASVSQILQLQKRAAEENRLEKKLSKVPPENDGISGRNLGKYNKMIPEPVKFIAEIGLNDTTRRLLREIVIEETWQEYNSNIGIKQREIIFREYAREQWETYPKPETADFESTFDKETQLLPSDLLNVAIDSAGKLFENRELSTKLSRDIGKAFGELVVIGGDAEEHKRNRLMIIEEIKRLLKESREKKSSVLEVDVSSGNFSAINFPVQIEKQKPPLNEYPGPFQYALVKMTAEWLDAKNTERTEKAYGLMIKDPERGSANDPEKMLSIYKSIRTRSLMKDIEKPVARAYLRLVSEKFKPEYKTVVEITPAGKKVGKRIEQPTQAENARKMLQLLGTQQVKRGNREYKRARLIKRTPAPIDPLANILDEPLSPPYMPGSPPYVPGSPGNEPLSPLYVPGSPGNEPLSPLYVPGSPPSESSVGFGVGDSDAEQERLAATAWQEMIISNQASIPDFREEFLKFLKGCDGEEPEKYILPRSDLYPNNSSRIPLLFGDTLLIPTILASICGWFNQELSKLGGDKKLKRRSSTELNPTAIHDIAEKLLFRLPPIIKSKKERLKKAVNFMARRLQEVVGTLNNITKYYKEAPLTPEETIDILDALYGRCVVSEDAAIARFPPVSLEKIVNNKIFCITSPQRWVIREFLNKYATNLYLGNLNTKGLRIFSPINPGTITITNAIEAMTQLLYSIDMRPVGVFGIDPEDRTDEQKQQAIDRISKIVNGTFSPEKASEKQQLLRRWDFIIKSSAEYVRRQKILKREQAE